MLKNLIIVNSDTSTGFKMVENLLEICKKVGTNDQLDFDFDFD